MISLENFRKLSLDKIDRSLPRMTKVMAFMLMVYAMLSFFVIYRTGELSNNILVLISVFVMIVASSLIFMDFSFNVHRTIGLYAIGIAANRFAKYFQGMDPPYGIPFVYNFVMLILAVNMFVTASFFLRGSVRGRFGMLMGSSLMLLGTLASFLFLTTTGGLTWDQLLVSQPDTIFLILLYFTLIFILNTSPIRTSTDQEKQMAILNTIRKTLTCDEKSYITRTDANVLLKAFTDRSGWCKLDKGPAESEYWLMIHHALGDHSYLVIQKWKKFDDTLFMTLTANREGAILDAYRFYANGVSESEDDSGRSYISFYSRDGLYSRILIKEAK